MKTTTKKRKTKRLFFNENRFKKRSFSKQLFFKSCCFVNDRSRQPFELKIVKDDISLTIVNDNISLTIVNDRFQKRLTTLAAQIQEICTVLKVQSTDYRWHY